MFFNKLILLSALLIPSFVFADTFRLEDLDKVPAKVKYIPISEGVDLKKKESLDVKQENRFTGAGMRRSFYMGTVFNSKLKTWTVPLFNNWFISSLKNNGCFKPAILNIGRYRTTRKVELGFNVWSDSKKCIIEDRTAQIYSIIYLNGRYVAIVTNMNVFVFDTQEGKVLNDYLETDGKVVQFFITEDKEIAVKASKDFEYDGSLRYLRNGEFSIYQDMNEADQIFLERLMIFYGDDKNLENQRKWRLVDFQRMLFNK